MTGTNEADADNENEDNPQLIKKEYRTKLIEHLSAEITTHSEYLTAFRTKMAFIVLIGPFVILGTFLVTQESIAMIKLPSQSIFRPASWAVFAYVALGFYGAILDGQIMTKCNEWRTLMVDLCSQKEMEVADVPLPFKYKFTFPLFLVAAYVAGILLVLGAFLAILFMLQTVPPKTASCSWSSWLFG